ncbi:MAG: alpha/beta fold hydrolase [Gordonia sp. (in: high G+C Gram-positive bacteria)]|uniref:alpha/beta fold hydrolase n=1 Tax=Gordonia sp. (in: high G+C Gram-positive bacteria) TaxID=84139 RepID=UPI003C7741A0
MNVTELGGGNDGIPVVFLHGIGGDGRNWRPQMEALADTYRVLAIDSRGFGESQMAGEDLALEDYADDIARTLDAVGIDRAHFVGLSMGGMITQALALNHPNIVASVVLADTSSASDETVATNLAASGQAALTIGMAAVSEMFMPATFCAAAIAEDREYYREFVEAFCATNPDAFNAGLQAIAGLNFTDRLPEIAVPALVIVGSDDMLLPVVHSETIAAAIPGATLAVLDGAGHMANLDSEAEFTQLLINFLEQAA